MKKIIAVILTVSFLAVTPAQADDPNRSTQAAGSDRLEKADRDYRDYREKREKVEESEESEDETTPSTGGGIVMTTQSVGGGIWCCTA